MRAALTSVRTWGSMIKFSHSVFALPFAVIGAFLAGQHIEELGRPYAGQLLLVVVCMVAARSVAMTYNRIVDEQIDAANPRTANRALPAGHISKPAAIAFLVLAGVTFAIACFSFLLFYRNPWPAYLGGPVLVCLCAYSFAKRFTRFSHFWLGMGIALSPVAAWVAIHPQSVGVEALVLMAAVTLWIAGFDIIYACQDIDVDRAHGLHSLPAGLGPSAALLTARACHAGTIVLLLILAHLARLGWLYLAGVVLTSVLLLVENCLVHPGDYRRVNLAFFTINGVVSLVLGTLAVIDILLGLGPVF